MAFTGGSFMEGLNRADDKWWERRRARELAEQEQANKDREFGQRQNYYNRTNAAQESATRLQKMQALQAYRKSNPEANASEIMAMARVLGLDTMNGGNLQGFIDGLARQSQSELQAQERQKQRDMFGFQKEQEDYFNAAIDRHALSGMSYEQSAAELSKALGDDYKRFSQSHGARLSATQQRYETEFFKQNAAFLEEHIRKNGGTDAPEELQAKFPHIPLSMIRNMTNRAKADYERKEAEREKLEEERVSKALDSVMKDPLVASGHMDRDAFIRYVRAETGFNEEDVSDERLSALVSGIQSNRDALVKEQYNQRQDLMAKLAAGDGKANNDNLDFVTNALGRAGSPNEQTKKLLAKDENGGTTAAITGLRKYYMTPDAMAQVLQLANEGEFHDKTPSEALGMISEIAGGLIDRKQYAALQSQQMAAQMQVYQPQTYDEFTTDTNEQISVLESKLQNEIDKALKAAEPKDRALALAQLEQEASQLRSLYSDQFESMAQSTDRWALGSATTPISREYVLGKGKEFDGRLDHVIRQIQAERANAEALVQTAMQEKAVADKQGAFEEVYKKWYGAADVDDLPFWKSNEHAGVAEEELAKLMSMLDAANPEQLQVLLNNAPEEQKQMIKSFMERR